ncbi:efflux RND transporter periplasmic adaptor subunit [Thalassovita taeanensis]|uniref:RND family efflux transporter, MFP subunit n=1 Tax=Thalassovita taeanensis TaxID=657014 RepID=A0A1H8Z1D7_9RHOB|nr:efflux RND transporter periplasmic adaptor subunit [Thalassovita taeanensis]SEP58254.1 RND family efflux transporter, MFP subunit [Thalassovita taeanensis]
MRFHTKMLTLTALLAMSGAGYASDALPITVVTARHSPALMEVVLTGVTEPRDSAGLAFRDGGRLLSIEVDVGDMVTTGQELGRVDATQALERLREAEASRAAITAQAERTQKEYERQGAMFDRGVTTRAALDAAREEYKTAQSSLDQVTAQVEQAQTYLDETVLRAPFDGTVTDRNADPGQIVNASTPVITIAADGGVDAVFSFPDTFLSEPPENNELILTLLDQPDVQMIGRLREVSPILDPQSGSVTVRVGIETEGRAVPLGAPIKGVAQYGAGDAFELPWSVLTATVEGPAVWVMDPQAKTVSLRPVMVESYLSGRVLLSEGLNEGELVVARGSHQLYPGRNVIPTGEH